MAGPLAFLAPDPCQSTQLIPGGNTPASGAQLFVYNVGTSTKTNSYTDPSASTARTNPIVLDSGGNIPGNGEVWITSTAKFVLAPANDTDPPTSPYWTRDNYYGINNITAAQVQALSAQSEWVQGSTVTFVGVTAFSLVGDQTPLYTLGRRVKALVTGGDRFGIVTSAVASGGSTAVGVQLDSGTLNAGLSLVSYGILSTPNGSLPWTQLTSTGANLSLAAITTGPLVVTGSTAAVGTLTVSGAFQSSTGTILGNLRVGPSTTPASVFVSIGSSSATAGLLRLPYNGFIVSRDSVDTANLQLMALTTINGVPDLLQMGGPIQFGSFRANSSNPTTSDVPTNSWVLWRTTPASTVRFFANVAGIMTSSAAFL